MFRSSSSSSRSSVDRIVHSVLAIAKTRVELFGIELAEEKDRLMSTVLFSVAALMIGMLALMGLSALVVILFWDSYRWQPLAILSIIYLMVAGFCLLRVRDAMNHAPSPFAATRAEFESDFALLDGKKEARHEAE